VSIVDLGRALRKRWRIVVVGTLLVEALFAIIVLKSTPQYTAKSTLYITSPAESNPTTQYIGQAATQSVVPSLVEVVRDQPVLEAVVTRLGLPYSWQHLEKNVSASVPLNSVLIHISVTDPSATRAALIANAIDDEFSSYIAKLPHLAGQAPLVNATVFQPAAAPSSPSSPKTTLDLVAGFLLGLAAGCGLALLRDSLDVTVKSTEEIGTRFGAVVLGAIPNDASTRKHPVAAVAGAPAAGRAEAFRQLRTNLQFVQIDEQPRSILVTSPVAEEGKTSVACNLAVVLAQIGVDVILLEGDLRRPRVAEYMGVERAVGLTSVLMGWTHWSEALQSWGAEDVRLRIMASGPLPPNPSEMLAGEHMDRLMTEMEDHCDVVIIDGPPLLPVADSALLAASATGTVLVVREGKTKRQHVARALAALEAVDARLYGIVLNGTRKDAVESAEYGRYFPQGSTPLIPRLSEHNSTAAGAADANGGSGLRRGRAKESGSTGEEIIPVGSDSGT
jgi:non-specific protein-tyrosine kinase